jgi:SAM-dependent methyltransferase
MNRRRISSIAHQLLTFAAPIDSDRADALIELLDVSPDDEVIDVGCGEAELLIRVLERYGCRGEGVDLSVERARGQAGQRLPPGRASFHERDIADFLLRDGAYSLAMCIGSTHIYGGLRPTLQALTHAVCPGGQILIGEGFWIKEPDIAALRGLESTKDEFTSLAGILEAGDQEGLTPLYVYESTPSEWDHYEWMWTGTLERYAQEHSDDPDAADMLDLAEQHRDGYIKGYRGTLGFVHCLFARWL